MTFAELGLSPEVLKAVEELGYASPTPIQAAAIPVVLSGRDILAAAQTGTGKTAAFTLPLLSRLRAHANNSASPAMHPVRALILTPTRELADQVSASVAQYNKYLPLRSTVVFGGMSMEPQKEALRRGVEVLVATPGRLLDHIEQKTVMLNRVEMLILDEADRMLDMGFIQDIRRIMSLLPASRQTLLFSATFAPEIKKLAADFMRDPDLVEVARQNATSDTIEQVVYAVDAARKRHLLVHLLQVRSIAQVIVFCRTRQGAEQLTRELKRDGLAAEAIHGDKAQSQRRETLSACKDGQVRVLVATDVAARGLDIEELPFVVNFELPNSPEDYVHRIGRTGRAGSKGIALSLMGEDEQRQLEAIESLIKQTLTPQTEKRFWPSWMPRPERPEQAPVASVSAALSASGAIAALAATPTRSTPVTPVRMTHPALRGEAREIPALLLPPRYR